MKLIPVILCTFLFYLTSLFAAERHRLRLSIEVLNKDSGSTRMIKSDSGYTFEITSKSGSSYHLTIFDRNNKKLSGDYVTHKANVEGNFIRLAADEVITVMDDIERIGLPPEQKCEHDCFNNILSDAEKLVSEGAPFSMKKGKYNIQNEKERKALVKKIIEEGPRRHAKTELDLPGGKFKVFNDALTLSDGTYVNFTFREAKEVARKWGCNLPNRAQAQKIRDYAEQKGNVYTARPKNPNNEAQRYTNINAMMNDSRMHQRAQVGRTKLINGHFKWYIDDGSNRFRFFGFRYPSSCKRTGYCQNGGSGGHGDDWIDYSQSVRLICPVS